MMIAALFVATKGVYFGLPDVDPWDEMRDARKYPGPYPVVAHPPCGTFSTIRHLSKADHIEAMSCADAAARAVRDWGGVLEQPAGSKMWKVFGFPRPGDPWIDPWGGCSWEVQQCDFGHPARKRTWLYCVRTIRPSWGWPTREPTHWCSGGRTKRPGMGATVPDGIKVCSAQQRSRTPTEFRDSLARLARSVVPRD